MKVNNPLDSDFHGKQKPISYKQMMSFIIITCIVAYGISFGVADETVKFIVYDKDMQEITTFSYIIEGNGTLEKIFYLKNISPISAKVQVTSNNGFIDLDVNIIEENLFQGEVTYIEVMMNNTHSDDINLILYVEGEYSR